MSEGKGSGIIIDGYRPGAIGRVAELHGTYYSRHWGFDLFFEAKVATGLSEFLGRMNPVRDRFWGAYLEDRLVGSIVIDGSEDPAQGAHLRWFMVDPSLQAGGVGARLLDRALGFCRERKFGRVYLWTFVGLEAARKLYDRAGFKVCQEVDNDQWGKVMQEQMMEYLPGD